jgi:hypothetical protein
MFYGEPDEVLTMETIFIIQKLLCVIPATMGVLAMFNEGDPQKAIFWELLALVVSEVLK